MSSCSSRVGCLARKGHVIALFFFVSNFLLKSYLINSSKRASDSSFFVLFLCGLSNKSHSRFHGHAKLLLTSLPQTMHGEFIEEYAAARSACLLKSLDSANRPLDEIIHAFDWKMIDESVGRRTSICLTPAPAPASWLTCSTYRRGTHNAEGFHRSMLLIRNFLTHRVGLWPR